jgi:hypothetical protein
MDVSVWMVIDVSMNMVVSVYIVVSMDNGCVNGQWMCQCTMFVSMYNVCVNVQWMCQRTMDVSVYIDVSVWMVIVVSVYIVVSKDNGCVSLH